MTYPKRLIEVDLPIRRISEHARRDQNIRKGHLHTMHVWWATRPLASCRAVIMATLLPDPVDPNCPQHFRQEARQLMQNWAKHHMNRASAESLSRLVRIQRDPSRLDDPNELRAVLLDFIADFAAWEAGVDEAYLKTARALVAAAHPDGPPLVLDPFAGAGSIPCEALRVGAQAFAGDLNPVAVLIDKVALEYLPKYGRRLAESVEKWGKWVLEEARKRLAPYYPADSEGNIPLAYIWARTITCEGPGCGAEVPLLGMLWLSRKSKNLVALRYRGIKPEGGGQKAEGESGRITTSDFCLMTSDLSSRKAEVQVEIFSPRSEREVQPPIVKRFAATCPCCGYTTPYEKVREQLRKKRGGTNEARMVAVITLDRKGGRHFRLPNDADREAAAKAARDLAEIEQRQYGGLSFVPHEPTPPDGTLGYRINKYGMEKWSDVYLPRQALALGTFCGLVGEVREQIVKEKHDPAYADAIASGTALAIGNMTHFFSGVSGWIMDHMISCFHNNGVPMRATFADSNPTMPRYVGGYEYALELVTSFLEREAAASTVMGTVQAASATDIPLPDDSVGYVVTDPPYYDAVPYAALSDFC